MRDVLIDVRCLQEPGHEESVAGRHAAALLSRARATLRRDRLIGLADPALPKLPAWVGAVLDEVRAAAYPGGLTRPACLVQLSPWSHDPLFVAPLLEHPGVPAAVALCPPEPAIAVADRLDRAVAQYWLARYDLFLPVSAEISCPGPVLVTGEAWREIEAAPRFWSAAGTLAPGTAPAVTAGRRPRVALLTPEPDPALCAALGQFVDVHVLPDPLAWAEPRFDRVLAIVANTGRHGPAIAALSRHGGDCVIQDACLLGAYHVGLGHKRTVAAAEAELGRSLGPNELAQWLAEEVRPGPLFLGEICRAAERIVVHSRVLAGEIARRYGREAVVLPVPLGGGLGGARPERTAEIRIVGFMGGVMGASCVGALDLLREWGVSARLWMAANGAELDWLPRWLGLDERVSFVPEAAASSWLLTADVALYLTMRGHGSLTSGLARSAGRGLPCVASHAVAEAVDAPVWVKIVPDPPSPVLIAEAILAALDAAPDGQARPGWAEASEAGQYARRLCEALGLG